MHGQIFRFTLRYLRAPPYIPRGVFGIDCVMTPATRAIAIFSFALASGCTGVENAPLEVITRAEPANVAALQIEPAQREAEVAAELPSTPVETPLRATVAKAAAPPAKAPVKLAAAPALIEEPRKIEASIAVTKAQEPALDLAGLMARLRDTNAIGVFTKLALKNQVDDLLKQFRAYHQGAQKSAVGSLRPPYDMLVLKVLAVVQDGDPSLARAISGSREAIWGILADREKFKSVT